jgi:hypothetical protein
MITEGNFTQKAGGPDLNDRNFKGEISFFAKYSFFSQNVRKGHSL